LYPCVGLSANRNSLGTRLRANFGGKTGQKFQYLGPYYGVEIDDMNTFDQKSMVHIDYGNKVGFMVEDVGGLRSIGRGHARECLY
jgi:hypothetical protein